MYGKNYPLLPILRNPEHGIEAWGLQTETENLKVPNTYYWSVGYNGTHFGHEFCDLFISMNYNPYIPDTLLERAAVSTSNVLKEGGYAFLVDPGKWSWELEKHLTPRPDLVREIKRYSMFTDQNVRVLQK